MDEFEKQKVQGTKIIKCKCKNEFQDKMYGKQQRVANAMVTGAGMHGFLKGYRCTVCRTEHKK